MQLQSLHFNLWTLSPWISAYITSQGCSKGNPCPEISSAFSFSQPLGVHISCCQNVITEQTTNLLQCEGKAMILLIDTKCNLKTFTQAAQCRLSELIGPDPKLMPPIKLGLNQSYSTFYLSIHSQPANISMQMTIRIVWSCFTRTVFCMAYSCLETHCCTLTLSLWDSAS